MTTSVTINGTNIASGLGWYPDGIPQWLTGPTRHVTTISIPDKPGVTVARTDFNAPRLLGITGTVMATSASNRVAAERTIKDLLYDGLVTIVVDDGTSPTIQTQGYLTDVKVVPLVPSMTPLASRVEASFLCPSPYWVAGSTTTVTLAVAGTSYATALGTAPSYPVITLTAPTNPVITYRDSAAATVKSLTFTITLTGADTLNIDMSAGTVTKTVSSVTTNALDAITSGNFPWALDPHDGVYSTSTWPDIKTSSGTGTVVYTKAYL